MLYDLLPFINYVCYCALISEFFGKSDSQPTEKLFFLYLELYILY